MITSAGARPAHAGRVVGKDHADHAVDPPAHGAAAQHPAVPHPLLEIADRYRLPERVLREILLLPRENWERLLRTAIQEQLTSDQVAEIGTHPNRPPKRPAGSGAATCIPGRVATSGLRRFANAIAELDEISQAQALDEVADLVVGAGQGEGLLFLLGELARLVQIRLDARRR